MAPPQSLADHHQNRDLVRVPVRNQRTTHLPVVARVLEARRQSRSPATRAKTKLDERLG